MTAAAAIRAEEQHAGECDRMADAVDTAEAAAEKAETALAEAQSMQVRADCSARVCKSLMNCCSLATSLCR